ncbi:hypothetical protein BH11BAC5_BH11BAC5_43140 [soil metagenome]
MNGLITDINDDEIIEAIRKKYIYHLNQSNRYKLMISAYEGNGILEKEQKGMHINKVNIGAHPATTVKRHTFEDKVVSILRGGQPMRVVDLKPIYQKTTGEDISNKDFSSKLSIRASANGSRIKLAKFNDKPFDQRFWWCLWEWFDGDDLKPEYISKIGSFVDKLKTDNKVSA